MNQKSARRTWHRSSRHGSAALGLLGLAAGCLVGATPTRAQTAPTYQLKIATVAPDGSTWMKVMRELDVQVRRETNNAVGFKIYPGGVQGDEQVVLRKIRSGQLHGGGFTGLGLGTIAPALRVMELPFLFQNYAQIDAAYAKLDPKFREMVHQKDFTLLGWAEVGFVYLFSKKPIASQSDLRSAKMWLWEGDPLAQAFFKGAGVTPVPLAITDVMTALQTGLVDGVYSSPLACLALQWQTRVSYYTDLPVTFATGAVVVSNQAFERIPAPHRDTVLRLSRACFQDLVQRTRKENADALALVEKGGVKRVPVTPPEISRFETIGKTVWKDQAGKLYPQSLLDEVLAGIASIPLTGAAR